MKVFSDIPLNDNSQDRFGRTALVDMIVDSIDNTVKSTHHCMIYGIYGKWGEGKTSLMNFIKSRLSAQERESDLSIVHFNPWLIGSQEVLLREYFSSVRTSVDAVAQKYFDKYGALVILASETIINKYVPKIGQVLGPFVKHIQKAHKDNEYRLFELKKKLSNEFVKSGKHCLVMIDDVDRLDKDELHSVMRLVRQVADFDNFIYILSMDVDIVSKSIGTYYGEGCTHDGRKFIDKIVQVPIVLPPIPENKIKELIREYLTYSIEEYCDDSGNEIPKITERIFPTIRTMRDLYRLCNQLSFVLPHLKGEVNVVDLCVLEAIKMISNEAFMKIYHQKSALTREHGPFDNVVNGKVVTDAIEERYDQAESAVVEGIDSLAKQTVLQLLRYLFGDKANEAYYQSNLNNKQLCTDVYFNKYFIQTVPSNLIADTELDDMAHTLSTMSVNDLTDWINDKRQEYAPNEIERSLIYMLYHCDNDPKCKQDAASIMAKTLSFYFIPKGNPILQHRLVETSMFVANQVLGKYLFTQDRNYSGFKICNEALLGSTMTEIFNKTELGYALNLLYGIYDYIAGSVKSISKPFSRLVCRFVSSTFDEQYSFSKELLYRFFVCWKEIEFGAFVDYANDIFTNKNTPYVKVIDKFIDSNSTRSSEQDVNVFISIFAPVIKIILARVSEDLDALKLSSVCQLLADYNDQNQGPK